jgi:pimeloyl-ACP methyl ester carboxylesterase
MTPTVPTDLRDRAALALGKLELQALQRAMMAAAGLRAARVRIGALELATYERTRGRGAPVVLIHGFGGDKETWLLFAPYLRRRPLILVDLPGHGASSPVDGSYANARAMRDALVGLHDARGIRRAHLAGNSMGGGVALWLARHHRERVASLALVASAAPELAESELTRALARGENLLIPRAGTAADDERFVRMMVEKPPRVPRAVQRYVAARRAAARPVLEELFRGYAASDPADTLQPADVDAIAQPTLIVHGEKDRIISPDTARMLHARLPQSRLEILDGIGHVPQLEAPHAVARLVERHLAAIDPT